MTQYPAPYSPPPDAYGQQMYWDPNRDLLAPARRASIFLFVYGGILLLCGGCNLVGAAAMRSPETVRRMRDIFPGGQLPSPREVAMEAIWPLGASIVFILLGLWVQSGKRRGIVTSIVIVSLILLQRMGVALFSLVGGHGPAAVAGFCACNAVFVVAPLTLLLVWLVQALRNSGSLDAAQAYAQQYWQYAQQYQQGYPQGYPQQYAPPGYGQGVVPPPIGAGQPEGSPPMVPAPPMPPVPPVPPGEGLGDEK